ncbi:MAG: hypothetical protein QXI16_00160 [Sulfolobaceae archaeon]
MIHEFSEWINSVVKRFTIYRNVKEEFSIYYNDIDYKGKTVLNIGSDVGLTPMLFLDNGANKVIGYSLDKQMYHNKNYDFRGCLSNAFYKGKLDLDKADVLVIDCEGCEYSLPINELVKYKEWIICLHSDSFDFTEYQKVIEKLGKLKAINGLEWIYVKSNKFDKQQILLEGD